MATLTWEAVGGDPAPGDPGAFASLAQLFSETADNGREARAALERFAASVDERIWKGEAADAFRKKIDELPPRLAKLQESYATAAAGLATYGRVLEDLKPRAQAVLSQARAAEAERQAQERNRDAAVATDAGASTQAYDTAIADSRRRVSSAEREIDSLRDRRRAAEQAAVRSLDRAHDQGIKNDPWYKRAVGAVGRWVDENADLLRAVSTGLKWVSAAAAVLSFVPVLAPICGPIAVATGGAALLMDAALAATGNGSWKMLALDAALMALPGAGRLVSRGIKTARGTTTTARISRGLQRKGLPRKVANYIGKRIEQGNKFNVTRSHRYAMNEVRLTNKKVVDSYTPGETIVSRKHTQLAKVRPSTARRYLREASEKYSPGEVIADTPANRARWPEMVGEDLEGQLVLEVPKQKRPIPQEVLDEAADLEIKIKEVSDFPGYQVGPPVSEVPDTFELVGSAAGGPGSPDREAR